MALVKKYGHLEIPNAPALFLAENAHKHWHGGNHADCARLPMLEELRF